MKIMGILGALTAVFFSGIVYMTMRFDEANDQYYSFITHESQAALLGARASAGIWTAVARATRLSAMDDSTPTYGELRSKLDGDFKTINERFQKVGDMVPYRRKETDA